MKNGSPERTMHITFREETRPVDADDVRRIVESTGFFTRDEVEVALELVQERLSKGAPSGYHFIFSENQDHEVLGYSCFGPIPCTRESFDLYWIAVHKDHQNLGLGKYLLEKTEHAISQMGGRRIYIETSSRALYLPTREFYLKNGYHEEACFKDFYSRGDNKIVYVKKAIPAS